MFDMQVTQNISYTLEISIVISLCKFKLLFDDQYLNIFFKNDNQKTS